MITSYSNKGRVSAISTQVVSAPSDNEEGMVSKALVGFHRRPKPRADEAVVRGAGCRVETFDESGSQITLQSDLHFFYPVRLTPTFLTALERPYETRWH